MMGQFQQCKTKVKEQNKEVMDFKGENNGEILIIGNKLELSQICDLHILMKPIIIF